MSNIQKAVELENRIVEIEMTNKERQKQVKALTVLSEDQ